MASTQQRCYFFGRRGFFNTQCWIDLFSPGRPCSNLQGRHHFRIPLGSESQKSRPLGQWLPCMVGSLIPNGPSNIRVGGHGQKHEESRFGDTTTTDISSVTKLTCRQMHPCFRQYMYRGYILDIHIWTYTVSMVHACVCPVYTYLYSCPESFHINEMSQHTYMSERRKCLRIS